MTTTQILRASAEKGSKEDCVNVRAVFCTSYLRITDSLLNAVCYGNAERSINYHLQQYWRINR